MTEGSKNISTPSSGQLPIGTPPKAKSDKATSIAADHILALGEELSPAKENPPLQKRATVWVLPEEDANLPNISRGSRSSGSSSAFYNPTASSASVVSSAASVLVTNPVRGRERGATPDRRSSPSSSESPLPSLIETSASTLPPGQPLPAILKNIDALLALADERISRSQEVQQAADEMLASWDTAAASYERTARQPRVDPFSKDWQKSQSKTPTSPSSSELKKQEKRIDQGRARLESWQQQGVEHEQALKHMAGQEIDSWNSAKRELHALKDALQEDQPSTIASTKSGRRALHFLHKVRSDLDQLVARDKQVELTPASLKSWASACQLELHQLHPGTTTTNPIHKDLLIPEQSGTLNPAYHEPNEQKSSNPLLRKL
ncbi:MAG: hypothetical protein ACOYKZ_00930 [Chlamydiia bacterium]